MNLMEIAQNFGVPVATLAGTCWFIVWLVKLHRDERREWRESSEKIQDRSISAIEKLTDVINARKD